MLSKISNLLSNYFIKKEIISEQDRETYNFCFEITLSTILNTIIIAVLAIIFKIYFEALIFTVTFMMFRGACGGAHAKTHIGCLLGLLVIFSVFILSLKFLPLHVFHYISVSFFILSILFVIILCPVDNINKPIAQVEKKKYKIKAFILLSIFTIITIILLVFQLNKYAFSVCYPTFCVAVSLIQGTVNNRNAKVSEIEIREHFDNEELPKSTWILIL